MNSNDIAQSRIITSLSEPSFVVAEPETTVFTSAHAEIVIDCPAQAVWGAILWSNPRSVMAWNPTVTELVRLSGAPDQEGEVVRVVKNHARVFFIRTVRLVQFKQRALFLYGEGYENGGNFVDHSLYEADGKTKFVYRNYTWKGASAAEAEQARADSERTKTELMNYFNNALRLLKQEVEGVR